MAQITRLEATYVIKSKLDSLLERLFGSNYEVQQQGDVIEVTAPRKLSDGEIDSIIIHGSA
ncbi:hypothetical protein F4777DRAFT_539419 [Nemania sp. FL0916]|nr:hypothetical protein F4777DRAFT_539419 [Nemania sp. FL0916]